MAYFLCVSWILSWINGGSEGATNNSKSNSSNKEDIVYLPQVVKAPRISKNFEFAGEKIPINVDTKERLERELTVNSYYHSNTVWALKMSTRYFPMMERILKENGIPDDFKYLAVAEKHTTQRYFSSWSKRYLAVYACNSKGAWNGSYNRN